MPGALPVYDFNANEAAEKAPVSHNTVLAMTGGQGRGKTRVPGQPFRRKYLVERARPLSSTALE